MMSERDLERERQGADGADGATGATGAQGERGRDAKAWRLWPALRLIAFFLVAAAAIYSSATTIQTAKENRALIERIEREAKIRARESAARVDQACEADEREHLRAVEGLKSTYLYLRNLTDAELGSTFNRFIIAQVPVTEQRAETDTAPAFCDQPGEAAEREYKRTDGKHGSPPVGLPEPDPGIPVRPDKVDQLIRDLAEQSPQLKRN